MSGFIKNPLTPGYSAEAEYFKAFGDLSERKNKKLKVMVNGKWIHFGDTRYEHFNNNLIRFKDFPVHNDKKRREEYLARAYGITDKKGRRTAYDINSPNYWSIRLLW